jgi:hypothetical protein
MLVGILEKSKRVRMARISLFVKFDMLSPEVLDEAFRKEPMLPAGSFLKGAETALHGSTHWTGLRLFRCCRSSFAATPIARTAEDPSEAFCGVETCCRSGSSTELLLKHMREACRPVVSV